MNRNKLALRRMRGVIDPYTLGFLISLIGSAIVYIAHGDKESDDAVSETTQMQNPTDASTLPEVEKKHAWAVIKTEIE